MNIPFRDGLPTLSTIVIKIGSRILTAPGHKRRVASLAEDVATLHSSGLKVILVSSGAISHGMRVLSLKKRPTSIPLLQACASIGQQKLMQFYEHHFIKTGIVIGQVLLTWDDLRSKKRYLNLRNTLFHLLDNSAIPIVNENDSVGIEEIQFGNNDMLGAQMALLTQADLFVNLTDVNGLHTTNPHTNKSAKHIPTVSVISSTLRTLVTDIDKEISVGGMMTKLKSIETVTRAGIYALIGNGFSKSLREVLSQSNASTLFIPRPQKMSSRHRWIAFTGQCAGTLIVDDGARNALVKSGKSLLPAGISKVDGSFKVGDKVEIHTLSGETIARGLVNYSADEIRIIQHCKTSEIEKRLGNKPFDEVVHRNNLVVLYPN
jgi:glutamate 5-kinase